MAMRKEEAAMVKEKKRDNYRRKRVKITRRMSGKNIRNHTINFPIKEFLKPSVPISVCISVHISFK